MILQVKYFYQGRPPERTGRQKTPADMRSAVRDQHRTQHKQHTSSQRPGPGLGSRGEREEKKVRMNIMSDTGWE